MAVVTRPPAGSPPAETSPSGAAALPAAPAPVQAPSVRGTVALAALLLGAADLMVLAGLVAVWFADRGVARAAHQTWPPKGTSPGVYVPVVISLTVVMSACSARWAALASARGDRRNALVAIGLTALLGLSILNAQSYAWTHLGFAVGRHAYATLYYALTGFHAANVVVGLGWMGVAAVRATAGHIGNDDAGVTAGAARFWHVGNAVWVVVFLLVYVFN
ncbi:MAG: cytochrome c oxidase subunit 3 [Acidimicrobiales bacterium]